MKKRILIITLMIFALLAMNAQLGLNRILTEHASSSKDIFNIDKDDWNNIDVLGTRHTMNTFSNGNEAIDSEFLEGGYNHSASIDLPQYTELISASMDIQGLFLNESISENRNFTDTINNSAWWGNSDSIPVDEPSQYTDTPFGNMDYMKINDDNNDLFSSVSEMNKFVYHHFSFSKVDWEFDSIIVKWKGSGFRNFPYGQGICCGSIYIYNNDTSDWDLVETFSMGGFVAIKILEREYYPNPERFFDINEKLHLIATTPLPGNGSTTEIMTDFVNVEFRGNISSYPWDPSLNVNNAGDTEWEYQGEYREKVTINDQHSFKEKLQECVNSNTDDAVVNIPLTLFADSPGILRLNNLSIDYQVIYPNQPPELILDIDNSMYSFHEDSNQGIGLIDLRDHFRDDEPFDNLTFHITGNTSKITAGVNLSTMHVDFRTEKDYFGELLFVLSAEDVEGLSVGTEPFMVTVIPTNDPPHFLSINGTEIDGEQTDINLEAKEGQINYFKFLAGDVDGDIPLVTLKDHFSYSEILELLPDNNNPLAVNLTIEPDDHHIGNINFSLMINDMNGSAQNALQSSYFLNISIVNTNDEPIISEMEEMEVLEKQWLNFSLKTADPDLPHDPYEKLTFATNFSQNGISSDKWSLNEETGNFTFKPDNDDIGTYRVNFSVKDEYDGADWFNTTINVINVNDPPVSGNITVKIIDAQGNTTVKENLTVSFSNEDAQDPDLIHGDMLTYSWDFDSRDGIKNDEEGLLVNHTYAQSGNYTVTLTVSDSAGLYSISTKNITVIAPVVQMEDDDDNDTVAGDEKPRSDGEPNGKKEKAGFSSGLVSLIIIIIIIIITAIILLVFMKKRKDKPNGSLEGHVEMERVGESERDTCIKRSLKPQHHYTLPDPGANMDNQGMPYQYDQSENSMLSNEDNNGEMSKNMEELNFEVRTAKAKLPTEPDQKINDPPRNIPPPPL